MLVPAHFRSRELHDAWRIIDRHGFGTVVTADADSSLVGSPLPFLGRPDCGRDGSLIGHIARANPQLDALRRERARALVVFQGPAAFVSASYYREQPAVPTWNHVTVTGRPRLLSGEAAAIRVLEQTVAHFEQQVGSDWRLNVNDPYVRKLSRQVAAFAVEVDRIEASFKLSQNITPELRRGVAANLLAAGHVELVAAMGRQSGLPCSFAPTGARRHGSDGGTRDAIRLLCAQR